MDHHQRLIVGLPQRAGRKGLNIVQARCKELLRLPPVPLGSDTGDTGDAVLIAGGIAGFRDAIRVQEQAFPGVQPNSLDLVPARRKHSKRDPGRTNLFYTVLGHEKSGEMTCACYFYFARIAGPPANESRILSCNRAFAKDAVRHPQQVVELEPSAREAPKSRVQV